MSLTALEARTLARPDCGVAYGLKRGRPGAPAVVLLHAYGVDRTMWEPLPPALEDCTVLCPDIRGHGDSRPCGGFTLPAAAEDLRCVLEAEGISRPVLVGLSMGGYLAQEYAWRWGGAAGYWVVGATPVLLDCYAPWERWSLERSTALFRPIPWGPLKAWMASASARTPEARGRVRDLFGRLTKEEFLRGWDGIAKCLHPEPGFRFDAPLMVSRGEYDRLGAIAKYMGAWEEAYPGAVVNTIPGASHVANLDAPGRFDALLRTFLARCAQPERRSL